MRKVCSKVRTKDRLLMWDPRSRRHLCDGDTDISCSETVKALGSTSESYGFCAQKELHYRVR